MKKIIEQLLVHLGVLLGIIGFGLVWLAALPLGLLFKLLEKK